MKTLKIDYEAGEEVFAINCYNYEGDFFYRIEEVEIDTLLITIKENRTEVEAILRDIDNKVEWGMSLDIKFIAKTKKEIVKKLNELL